MTSIQLRAELLRELNPIFDSDVAMRKALTALRDIRKVTSLMFLLQKLLQEKDGLWLHVKRIN